jgi:DNA helicase HerA-like ATPase
LTTTQTLESANAPTQHTPTLTPVGVAEVVVEAGVVVAEEDPIVDLNLVRVLNPNTTVHT